MVVGRSGLRVLFRSTSVDGLAEADGIAAPCKNNQSFTCGDDGRDPLSRPQDDCGNASLGLPSPVSHNLLDAHDDVGTSSELLSAVTISLDAVVHRNEQEDSVEEPSSSKLTVFHGLRPPPISLEAYLERIAKYAKCSPICFVMALSYLEVLVNKDVCYRPTNLSVHRLVLTAVMLAAKFIDDHYFNNSFYAKVGGVSTQEVNRMELEMLQLLDFRCFVSAERIRYYLKHLQAGTFATGCLFSTKKRRSTTGVGGDSRGHRRTSRRSSMDSTADADFIKSVHDHDGSTAEQDAEEVEGRGADAAVPGMVSPDSDV